MAEIDFREVDILAVLPETQFSKIRTERNASV